MVSMDIRDRIKQIARKDIFDGQDIIGTVDSLSGDQIDSILEAMVQVVESKKQKLIPKGKIYCKCECNGPFCNTFMHQCYKPKEHYPQRDQAVIDIQNEVIDDLLSILKGEKHE